MKTIIKVLTIAILFSGFSFMANAQDTQEPSGKLVVNTQLQESQGTYGQRKVFRTFLKDYMKDCPYISHFSIHEALNSSDNHEVVWTYEVNSWNDITAFYNWVGKQLKSKSNEGFKNAMTPYQPDYAIGGKIHVERRSKSALARY